MIAMNVTRFSLPRRLTVWFSLVGLLTGLLPAQADPTIVSPPPANGVSPSAPIVFVFSEAMDPDATTATFYDSSTFTQLATTDVWSAGNTVLTCTPTPAFPSNKSIVWAVDGANPGGDPLGGIPGGVFTTGSGSGGGTGSGTNAITSFVLGKLHRYHQTSASAPTLDPDYPYAFQAVTSLSSNRTATNIVLTLPTGSVSNLAQNFFQPEVYSLIDFDTNLSRFDATFPAGDYLFTVKAVNSNQTVTVNFPAAMTQPAAPHLANFAAAQAVNPATAFALQWDAFPGGTASDFIQVEVGEEFSSDDLGKPGALPGTATSVTIPAGTLQANSNYDGSITFYRYVGTTNGTSYVTTVYRATITDFTLQTSGGATGGSLILTNEVFAPSDFSFDVLCAAGQMVTVEYRTDLAAGPWQTLFTTNSPGTRFRAVAPQSTTHSAMFFRARNGP